MLEIFMATVASTGYQTLHMFRATRGTHFTVFKDNSRPNIVVVNY